MIRSEMFNLESDDAVYFDSGVASLLALCQQSRCSGRTVFKLTPNADGTWSESVLYGFCSKANCKDGGLPYELGTK